MRHHWFLIGAVSVLFSSNGCAASSPRVVSSLESKAPIDLAPGEAVAVFAGGCFWGVEAVFEQLNGVRDVVSGYAGGEAETATYEAVGTGVTGHAETVRVVYNPTVVSYRTLLEVFFTVAHDPTQLNYQGPDVGTQYRSAIFYNSEEERAEAEKFIASLSESRVFASPIITSLEPLKTFYPAEAYHQNFMRLHPDHPYIRMWDAPKLVELQRRFPALLASRGDFAGSAAISDADSGAQWYGYSVIEAESAVSVPVQRTADEWRSMLGDIPFAVLRLAETERPYSGALLDEHRRGTFYSAATGQPLFRSETKFESGTGWPSFSKPIQPDAVVLRWDLRYGMRRVEVVDSSSGSHLGHVFDDGPPASAAFLPGTGLRFCLNSVSLVFVADGEPLPPLVAAYAKANAQDAKPQDKPSGSMMSADGARSKPVFDVTGLGPSVLAFTTAADAQTMAASGPVVYFFAASWCPTCRATYRDILANYTKFPADFRLVVVNYDTETKLKAIYGVSYQHTFVRIDSAGKALKVWSGSGTVADIVAK